MHLCSLPTASDQAGPSLASHINSRSFCLCPSAPQPSCLCTLTPSHLHSYTKTACIFPWDLNLTITNLKILWPYQHLLSNLSFPCHSSSISLAFHIFYLCYLNASVLHPHFTGIFFPILKNPDVFKDCIDLFVEHINKSFKSVDVIVGLDSRGFLFGPMIAQQLHIAFIPIRKAGKLPGEKFKTTYKFGIRRSKVQHELQRERVIFDRFYHLFVI